jgi:hypothetical protein
MAMCLPESLSGRKMPAHDGKKTINKGGIKNAENTVG